MMTTEVFVGISGEAVTLSMRGAMEISLLRSLRLSRGGVGEGKRQKGKQAVLFLKKKNQKNFCPFAGINAEAQASRPDGSKWVKVFLLLFFQKKKMLAYLRRTLIQITSRRGGRARMPAQQGEVRCIEISWCR
jgi:hypothetical protein